MVIGRVEGLSEVGFVEGRIGETWRGIAEELRLNPLDFWM